MLELEARMTLHTSGGISAATPYPHTPRSLTPEHGTTLATAAHSGFPSAAAALPPAPKPAASPDLTAAATQRRRRKGGARRRTSSLEQLSQRYGEPDESPSDTPHWWAQEEASTQREEDSAYMFDPTDAAPSGTTAEPVHKTHVAVPSGSAVKDKRKGLHSSNPQDVYRKLAPPQAPHAPPQAHQAKPKQVPSVRDLGRELIRQHMRAQDGAPPSPHVSTTHLGTVQGLPQGMQSILDAYTKVAGDVERLTGIPAPPRRDISAAHAHTDQAAHAHGQHPAAHSSRERFSRVPGSPGLRRVHTSAPATAAARQPAPSSPLKPRQRAHRQPRASSESHSGRAAARGNVGASSESTGFGLSSVLAQRTADADFGHVGHAEQAKRKQFGLAGVLQSAARQSTGKPPPSPSRLPRKTPARTKGDLFDEGSWIYIMGASTSSVKAKRLAAEQRARAAAAAR